MNDSWTTLMLIGAAALALGMALGFMLSLARIRRLGERITRLSHEASSRTEQLTSQGQTIRTQVVELKAAVQERERLLAAVSHEFRTPLTLLLGYARRLRSGHGDPAQLAARTEACAQRLKALVDGMLAMAEPQDEASAATDLSLRTRQIIDRFADAADRANIRVQAEIQAGCHGAVRADAYDHILSNLLSNALKYSIGDGTVLIGLTAADDAIVLRVRDQGIGIAPAERPHVFDPFYRGQAASEVASGSGVGLAVVAELVERANGSVTIAEHTDPGAEFVVRIPSAASSESASAPTVDASPIADAAVHEAPIPAAPADAESIAIVEDDRELRHFLNAMLSAHYAVTAYDSAEAAATGIASDPPDLVVSDVRLPGRSGLELAAELRDTEATSHIPIILLTALAAREHRLEGLAAQVDDYLTKPFDEDELLSRIRNLLTQRKALHDRFRRRSLGLPQPGADREERFLEALSGQLKANPASEIADLTAAVHLSERQLQRKLQSLTGLTPSDYLRQFRLRRAAALLEDGLSATEAGLEAGFKDYSHFSRTFKAHYGMPPGRYAALAATADAICSERTTLH